MIKEREKRAGVVVKDTTLNKLRIAPRYDPYKFGSDRLTVAMAIRETGERYTLGLVDHYLLGEQLDHVLRLRAPYKAQEGKGDTLDDFQAILDATKNHLDSGDSDYDKYIAEMNRRHRGDPNIAQPFMEFVRNHLERWTEALGNDEYDAIFQPLPKLVLLSYTQIFIPQVLSQSLHPLAYYDPRDNMENPYTVRVNRLITYANEFSDNSFAKFINQQPEVGNYLGIGEEVKFLNEYFSKLSPGKQQAFIQGFATYEDLNIVDFENRKIWEAETSDDSDIHRRAYMSIPYSDYGVLRIGHFDCEVKIRSGYANPSADWQIDYRLPPEYRNHALLPLIAIQEDPDGGRRFMTQPEAMETLDSFALSVPEQADVALGRVVMSLSSSVEGWATDIPFKGENHKQPMLTAQVPAWVSLDCDEYPNAGQLLSDKNNFYPTLVQFATTSTLPHRFSRAVARLVGI